MPSRKLGQIAAICSSIVLVGGYLLYRVSAGDRGTPIFSSSKSGRVVPQSGQPASTEPAQINLPVAATEPAVLLPGSKSAAILDQTVVQDGSLIISTPPGAAHPATPSTAPAPAMAPTTKPSESFKLK